MVGQEFHFLGTDQDREKWVYCDYETELESRLAYALPVKIIRCASKEITVRKRLTEVHFRCD